MKSYIIALDGPSGAGKGEIARQISKKYNLLNVGSGSFYRAASYYLLKKMGNTPFDNPNLDIDDANLLKEIEKNLKDLEINYSIEEDKEKVIVNGEDVSIKVREPQISHYTSVISAIPLVRNNLNEIFRTFAKDKKIIMEGRDIGSEVFPNADLKIYLDASIKERARRRFLQNKDLWINESLEEVENHLKERDKADRAKKMGKLQKTKEHILVDNTTLSIEETLNVISKYIDELEAK